MAGHGSKFALKMESAVAALLSSPTMAAAAETCGISESTLRVWTKDEKFSELYREARTRLLEATVNSLRARSVEAVNVLVAISSDTTAPPAVRVSAARSIIALGFAAEMAEIEERLSELEQIAQKDQ